MIRYICDLLPLGFLPSNYKLVGQRRYVEYTPSWCVLGQITANDDTEVTVKEEQSVHGTEVTVKDEQCVLGTEVTVKDEQSLDTERPLPDNLSAEAMVEQHLEVSSMHSLNHCSLSYILLVMYVYTTASYFK